MGAAASPPLQGPLQLGPRPLILGQAGLLGEPDPGQGRQEDRLVRDRPEAVLQLVGGLGVPALAGQDLGRREPGLGPLQDAGRPDDLGPPAIGLQGLPVAAEGLVTLAQDRVDLGLQLGRLQGPTALGPALGPARLEPDRLELGQGLGRLVALQEHQGVEEDRAIRGLLAVGQAVILGDQGLGLVDPAQAERHVGEPPGQGLAGPARGQQAGPPVVDRPLDVILGDVDLAEDLADLLGPAPGGDGVDLVAGGVGVASAEGVDGGQGPDRGVVRAEPDRLPELLEGLVRPVDLEEVPVAGLVGDGPIGLGERPGDQVIEDLGGPPRVVGPVGPVEHGQGGGPADVARLQVPGPLGGGDRPIPGRVVALPGPDRQDPGEEPIVLGGRPAPAPAPALALALALALARVDQVLGQGQGRLRLPGFQVELDQAPPGLAIAEVGVGPDQLLEGRQDRLAGPACGRRLEEELALEVQGLEAIRVGRGGDLQEAIEVAEGQVGLGGLAVQELAGLGQEGRALLAAPDIRGQEEGRAADQAQGRQDGRGPGVQATPSPGRPAAGAGVGQRVGPAHVAFLGVGPPAGSPVGPGPRGLDVGAASIGPSRKATDRIQES